MLTCPSSQNVLAFGVKGLTPPSFLVPQVIFMYKLLHEPWITVRKEKWIIIIFQESDLHFAATAKVCNTVTTGRVSFAIFISLTRITYQQPDEVHFLKGSSVQLLLKYFNEIKPFTMSPCPNLLPVFEASYDGVASKTPRVTSLSGCLESNISFFIVRHG